MNKTIIIGGDKRQRALFKLLKAKGINCFAVFEKNDLETLKNLSEYSAVILPIPVSKDGTTVFSENEELNIKLADIRANLSKEGKVIGGNFSDSFRAQIQEKGATVIDLFAERDFALYNAFLTAQGAIRLLLENSEDYIVSKRVLVTGFGKVGKATAQFLRANGTDVYVFARRREVQTQAKAMGFGIIKTGELSSLVRFFDYIFNTVPYKIFDKSDIKHMKKGAVYFELASSPFGADREAFLESEAVFVSGSGLPGRFCPLACAKEIENRIDKYLEKESDCIE